MRTFNFEPFAPVGIMNILSQGKAFGEDLNLSDTDKLNYNGTTKTLSEWRNLANNDIKEFHTLISKKPNGKLFPLKCYVTNTEYGVNIYIVKGRYRVSVYNTVERVNIVGEFEQWSDATAKAEEVVKQYC